MTEQSITGSFLIAHPRSEPNYFSETLIYVLDNDGQGSLGFVVNRAAETTLSDVLTEVPSELADASLLLGGPVQSDCLRFLSIHIADP